MEIKITNMKYLDHLINIILLPSKLSKKISYLKSLNYVVNFKHEGDIEIKIPKVNFSNTLTRTGRKKIFQSYLFTIMPTKEALLRKCIYDLYQTNYLSRDKSIIDIGCWIGDNSLVWSKILGDGKIFAIDPIPEALEFAAEVASINKIQNIEFLDAVCSDVSNMSLKSSGTQGGTYFNETSSSEGKFKSTTIDEVIALDFHDTIDLFHVDVEGFENKVILGAENVIKSSRPLIIFEQHISSDDTSILVEFLKDLNYEIFMLNEVLPGCALDCRNFIAFDANKPLPEITNIANSTGRENNIWFATLGPSLVKISK
jgi:FkbM family methyltransferase